MEFIKEHYFYLIGILYIINIIHDIILRIKDREINAQMDMTDINSIIESNKNIKSEAYKAGGLHPVLNYTIMTLSLVWIIIGVNSYDIIEKFYFIIILITGFAIPVIISVVSALNVYSDMKEKQQLVINAAELRKSKMVKQQRLFYYLLNTFEIVIVCLILNNHFQLLCI